jgi:WD40 repeat protein
VVYAADVWTVGFSPDSQHIVTTSEDQTAKVWEAVTGQDVLTLKHPTSVWSVAFSPDGQRLVTGMAGADAIAKVWFAAPMPQMAAWAQAEPAGEKRLAPARVDQKEQAVR